MRILVLADIHGNMPALKEIAKKESWDIMLCLGDLVDYGPWPDEVIDFIKENADYVVLGNHDYSLAFDGDCGCTSEYIDLTMYSRKAVLDRLNESHILYLKSLPQRLKLDIDGLVLNLVHGSIRHPLYGFVAPFVEENKIREEMDGAEGIVLFGHSHYAMQKRLSSNLVIINPGSVGFPKGDDPRTSYGVFEDGKYYQKKLEYDIESVVNGIKNMDMPMKVKDVLIYKIKEGK